MAKHTKKKTRLRKPRVTKVALVPAGDDPEARIVLAKSKDHRDIEKSMTFDERLEESQLMQAVETLDGRMAILSSVIWSAIHDPDVTDKAAAVKESVGQFADSVNSDLGQILAGNIIKEDPETEGDLRKILWRSLGALSETARGDDPRATKEIGMKKDHEKLLAAVGEEHRDAIKKIILAAEAAGKDVLIVEKARDQAQLDLKKVTDDLAKSVATIDELETKLIGDDEGKKLAKAIDAAGGPVRDAMKKLQERAEKAESRTDLLVAKADIDAFKKDATPMLKGVPGDHDEIVKALLTLDADDRDLIVKTLGSMSELVQKGLDGLGSSESDPFGGPDADKAMKKIHDRRDEIVKEGKLDENLALIQAIEELPDEYAKADRRATIN